MANQILTATPPEFRRLKTSERRRTYIFPGGDRLEYKWVSAVAISERGTHRLELSDGAKVIVRPGWLAVELDTDDWEF
jgi:hypothetical protein